MIDDEEFFYIEPSVCECGYVDDWCEYCGFHGHECPLDTEEQ